MIIIYLIKLKIVRFRGLEKIEMKEIRHGTNLIIGPNDAGKTTILEAIKLLLSPRLGVVLSESDYFLQDISKGFEIEGQVLCKWDQNFEKPIEFEKPGQKDEGGKDLSAISENSFEIVVEGTDNMQLKHSVKNPHQLPEHVINFAMKSLAEAHLVGSNRLVAEVQPNPTIAQSEIPETDNGHDQESVPLVISGEENSTPITRSSKLSKLQRVFNKNGLISRLQKSSPEAIIGPNLAEMNLTTEQAGVQIPISCLGTGDYSLADRLTPIQSSVPIILIDKIEGDLDSNRQHIPLENLLESPKQSFVSTLNPKILSFSANFENSKNLTIWHLDPNGNIAKSEGKHTKIAHRSNPNAYFSKIPIIGEGATEAGLLQVFLNRIFKDGYKVHGIEIFDGGGNPKTIFLANEWIDSNHKLFFFVDNEDDPSIEGKLETLKGHLVNGAFQWRKGNTEENIINAVPEGNLEHLIKHPADARQTRARLRTILEYLNKSLPNGQSLTFENVKRVAGDQFRQTIINSASGNTPAWFKGKKNEKFSKSGSKWYKSLEGGKELGEKMYSCEAWSHLKDTFKPFSDTLKETIGLRV